MAWTNEQLTAIHKDGTNIIVSPERVRVKQPFYLQELSKKLKKEFILMSFLF